LSKDGLFETMYDLPIDIQVAPVWPKLLWRSAIAALWTVAVAQAQPFIYSRGIVNAASFVPPGLPGGSIAQGSLFSVFGTALGPSNGVQVSAFPLGTSFQGVSVRVTRGAAAVDAIPVYVQANS
jgi:hypothetical protein